MQEEKTYTIDGVHADPGRHPDAQFKATFVVNQQNGSDDDFYEIEAYHRRYTTTFNNGWGWNWTPIDPDAEAVATQRCKDLHAEDGRYYNVEYVWIEEGPGYSDVVESEIVYEIGDMIS